MTLMQKRVIFPSTKQKRFLENAKKELNLTWKELSKKLSVNENTLSKAYCFETCNMPLEIFQKIVKLLNKNEKKFLQEYEAKITDSILIIGRKMIGEQKKKFDDIRIPFKEKAFYFNLDRIEYSQTDKEKKILFPKEINSNLAEEIGAHYGDGFLSESRYDYRLKGNTNDEKPYYEIYLKRLFKELYNLEIKPKQYQSTYGIELSSKALWTFKTKVLGIKPGNKKEIRLPSCIKVDDLKIIGAFLRGLFDTDGSFYFKTRYGYKKYYPEIKLELFSIGLTKEVRDLLKMLGFAPNFYIARGKGIITMNGIGSLLRYEKLIGWSSQKNLNKVNEWKIKYPELNKEKIWRLSSNGKISDCGSLDEGSIPSLRP